VGAVPVWTNWAATATATPLRVESPRSFAEVADAITRAADARLHVKPIGAGHSFTPIAATDGVQLRLDKLNGIVRVDQQTGLVTVRAGTRLRELNPLLWQLGLSMSNLGDVDVQTISGAISTGTHGTGIRLGGLATQVHALQIVLADGTMLDCSRRENADVFAAARVGLGALGVLATVTLKCEPAFALRAVEAPASLDATLERLDDLVRDNDHFEFYWFPHTRRVLTKQNNRVEPGTPLAPVGRLRGYVADELLSNRVFDLVNRLATVRPELIPRLNSISARALSPREYVDRSHAVFTSSRQVRFREMEYAVPRDAVPHVLAEIDAWLARNDERIAFPVEVRFAAADDIWLSTAYQRESGYIAVHQYVRREHQRYFDAVEAIAMSVDGRPHWGKLHRRDAASLRRAYPRFGDFVALRDRLDPNRVFGNDYLVQVLGA
jgi:L-gulonolactone oxidase